MPAVEPTLPPRRTAVFAPEDMQAKPVAVDAAVVGPAAPKGELASDSFEVNVAGGVSRTTPRAPLASTVPSPGPSPSVRRGLGEQQAVQPTAPRWGFNKGSVGETYDAHDDVTDTYDIKAMAGDVPGIWNRKVGTDVRAEFRSAFKELGGKADEKYGEMFKRVGAERGVDPYALATYCMFESYNGEKHSFNPHMKQERGSMYAAGIGATQAQHVAGAQTPGLRFSLPDDVEGAGQMLRASPETSVRFLADEMRAAYAKKGQDLARSFPYVAFPAWKDPERSMGDYGTQAEYVSRAAVLYKAFAAADATMKSTQP